MKSSKKNKTDKLERVNCEICRKDNNRILYTAFDERFGVPGKFNIVQCLNCGLVYINPRPSREKIEEFYPKRYYTEQSSNLIRSLDSVRTRLNLLFGYEDYLQSLNKGRLLDVGCGKGIWLNALKKRGWKDLYGLDMSSVAADYAQKIGFNIFIGELEQARYPSGYFDVVSLQHSLEHLHHPKRILKEIYRILKPGGTLAVVVPNIDSVEAKLLKGRWVPGLDVPRHLYDFSPKTLSLLMEKERFCVSKIAFSTTPNFVISLSFLKAFRRVLLNNKPSLVFFSILASPFDFASTALGKGATMMVCGRK